MHFRKVSKDDIAPSMLFVGRAQEKPTTFARARPTRGWWSTRPLVNHFHFHGLEDDFGPLLRQVRQHFPYAAKVCIKGHEWAKRQAAKAGIDVEALDNGFLSCAEPARFAGDLQLPIAGAHRRLRAQGAGPPAPILHRRRRGRLGYRYDLSVPRWRRGRQLRRRPRPTQRTEDCRAPAYLYLGRAWPPEEGGAVAAAIRAIISLVEWSLGSPQMAISIPSSRSTLASGTQAAL